jgi:hypothetical protein
MDSAVPAIQTQLARDHAAGEVAFGQEDRHDINLVALDEIKRIAQRGLLLPEGLEHLVEDAR